MNNSLYSLSNRCSFDDWQTVYLRILANTGRAHCPLTDLMQRHHHSLGTSPHQAAALTPRLPR